MNSNESESNFDFKLINNQDFKFCETYPQFFAVPTKMSINELKKCSEFRTKNRLPALVYSYKIPLMDKKVTMWRSSQNRVLKNFFTLFL